MAKYHRVRPNFFINCKDLFRVALICLNEETDKEPFLDYLSVKILSIGIISMRVIALTSVLIILGINVWFFA